MLSFKLRHAVLLASLMFIPAVHASSFDCASAASPAEKTICSDPYISNLDEKLGSQWRATLPKVVDSKALKVDQRGWLKQRNQCAADVACLRRQYLMRLKALEFMTSPFNWDATWQLIPWGVSSAVEVKTRRIDATHIAFDISGVAGANSGDMEGVATIEGSEAHYAQDNCSLKFSAFNGLLDIAQEGADPTCGGGMGIYYGGRYVASEQPLSIDYDLLSLGVARTEQENQLLHTLLKDDYQTLLQNSGAMVTGEASRDVPEAQVDEFWLRGLANTNAGVLMRAPDARVWLVLLVFDEQRKLRARYYTNVPKWKKRVPEALLAWHKRIADGETLPLDFMP
ncbi:lysozyme inhibitor LprI family protein [Pseudomonas serboccidentalis]|uniref:lysozyme inhibitor LprI family protein n=1 Tax=Pseudomonas serboccidentalis TaxID=2964670 RepID=UPI0039E04E7D